MALLQSEVTQAGEGQVGGMGFNRFILAHLHGMNNRVPDTTLHKGGWTAQILHLFNEWKIFNRPPAPGLTAPALQEVMRIQGAAEA